MPAEDDIKQAGIGFDLVFENDLDAAKAHFSSGDSSFHLMGLGCVAFLQAALGMESGLMSEASHILASAEAKAKKEAKTAKAGAQARRFAPGLDFEILQADAMLLLGFTQALSESYTGYLQCMYSLNRIYKSTFPDGLDKFATPSSTPLPSRKPSTLNISQQAHASAISLPLPESNNSRRGLFGLWGSSSSRPTSRVATPIPDGPIEEFVISGAAFGYGLFNLVLSLLPAKIKGVVGFFGYNSDRRSALQALAVAATKDDAHGVFAGLTLMTYHGSVLLLTGYQADEAHILKQYRAIVDKLKAKYPSGSLWALHSAKILRMTSDQEGAISLLQASLAPERSPSFLQADALLVFDLAWTLLAQRRYQESADMFIKMTELNSWSHATYQFIAAGCYLSLGNLTRAKALLENVPVLLEGRKLGGRDLPIEVFIRKKSRLLYFQTRRGRPEANYIESIRISPAEELGLVWNVHGRITLSTAQAHIREWTALSPSPSINTPFVSNPTTFEGKEESLHDLDTPDELALRSLLMGVVHMSICHFSEARAFLLDTMKYQVENKWINAQAFFELAVLHLKEAEALDKADAETGASLMNTTHREQSAVRWKTALKEAGYMLDGASDASTNTDLSSRLDPRISLLRDEVALKRKIISEDGL